MGLPKRRPEVSPHDRAMQFWMRSVRPPQRDHDAVIALAKDLGADVADAIEWFEDRSAQREYEANVSRAEAEKLALEDVRCILVAKIAKR